MKQLLLGNIVKTQTKMTEMIWIILLPRQVQISMLISDKVSQEELSSALLNENILEVCLPNNKSINLFFNSLESIWGFGVLGFWGFGGLYIDVLVFL